MNTSPRWGRSTKQLVSATLVILAGLLLYSFRTIVTPLVIIFLLAYVLAPVIGWLSRTLHISRGLSVVVLYLIGLASLATIPALTIPVAVNEVRDLVTNLESIIQRTIAWLEQFDRLEFPILGYIYTIPLPEVDALLPTFSLDPERIISLLEGTISPLAGGAFSVVLTVASGVGWVVLMSVMGFYLLADAERIGPALLTIIPVEHRGEVSKLFGQINATWNAFLRGQLVLCIVIGVITGVAMSAVGIRFSIALGIVAGILEIIPSFGPTLAAIPAILLALFQGSSYLPLPHLTMAILVAGIYVVIQSLENNLFVPRIIGSSLNLHPLVVIIGFMAGATLGGILGALLAAQVLATLRDIIRYLYYKLADIDPFPPAPSFASIVRERDIRAILFDLDGTLLDTDDMLVERWAGRLDRVPLLRRLYKGQRLARRVVMAIETPMNALITLLDILGLDEKFFALSDWVRLILGQRTPAQYVAIEGAVQFIRELSTTYDLAIITTRSRVDTSVFLKAFGLIDCFEVIVTRQDVKRLKPHPEPVRQAAEKLGLPPEQCVIVGDTTVDVQAGKRAGALTVGVLCGFGERPELERLQPNLLLETTTQLGQRLPREEQTWCDNW